MAIERVVISLSLAPGNPDAMRVLEALEAEDVRNRKRSELLLSWLAAYLDGRTREQTSMAAAPIIDEDKFDELMADF